MTTATKKRSAAIGIDKPAPANLDMENAVLGCILIDPAAIANCVAKGLRADHFFDNGNSTLYRAIAALHAEGKPTGDVKIIVDRLRDSGDLDKVGGLTRLTAIAAERPTAHNWDFYCGRVLDLARRRQLLVAANNTIATGTRDSKAPSFADR